MDEGSGWANAYRFRALRIFLCHASVDKAAVRALYEHLQADGFRPWLDTEDLLPGSDWRLSVERELRDCDVALVCLSAASVNTTGYVQKEIKYAIDFADEHPDDHIYLIPVRLESCIMPERLNRWHWVDFHEPDGYSKLVRSLDAVALNQVGLEECGSNDALTSAISALHVISEANSSIFKAIYDCWQQGGTSGYTRVAASDLSRVSAALADLQRLEVISYKLTHEGAYYDLRVDFSFRVTSPAKLTLALAGFGQTGTLSYQNPYQGYFGYSPDAYPLGIPSLGRDLTPAIRNILLLIATRHFAGVVTDWCESGPTRYLRAIRSEHFKVGPFRSVEEGALWQQAVEVLEQKKLIQGVASRPGYRAYALTRDGWDLAESLRLLRQKSASR